VSDTSLYTVGEAVPPDRGLYVERSADIELLKHCLHGESAHILASRQVGKTSLIVRTMHKLKLRGIRAVFFDLQVLGKELTQEEWFNGLITTIGDQLGLTDNLLSVWNSKSAKPCGPRLIDLFLKSYCACTSRNVS